MGKHGRLFSFIFFLRSHDQITPISSPIRFPPRIARVNSLVSEGQIAIESFSVYFLFPSSSSTFLRVALTLFMTASRARSIALASVSLLLNDVSQRRYSGSIGRRRAEEVEGNSPANPRWVGNWPIFGRTGGRNLSVAALRLPERGFSPRLTVHVPRLVAATSFLTERAIDMSSFSLFLSRSLFFCSHLFISLPLFLAVTFHLTMQSQIRPTNKLPLFANWTDTLRPRIASPRDEFFSEIGHNCPESHSMVARRNL